LDHYRYEDKISLPVESALVEGVMEVEVEEGEDEDVDDAGGGGGEGGQGGGKGEAGGDATRARILYLKIARFAVSREETPVPDLPDGVRF
jgi:hypothetical protein